ncbi:hypothetical protein LWI29_017025 [Acer saccharum]|uniref:rhamnogalacturonan endolyase n=1 Tax=Acer saccharum TaxID=4024 RepID=A0AA39RS43_ACESA|nr:hypothetical protein LWI29_017025 [Acer saccharum]
MAKNKVRLITKGSYVILDNGLVTVTISKPQGCVTGIKYGGMGNILDLKSSESSRGLSGDEYNVINMSNDVVEVSFKNSFNPSDSRNKLPLSVDIRYILRSGVSGFHCNSIYERPDGSKKALDLAQTRMVFKLRRDRFHYMAITDEKQRIMPMPDDLLPDRGKQLIVPESVLLVNPINCDLKGEIILGNGLVAVTISKPQGCVIGINYGGMDNILDLKSSKSSRGLSGDEYNVINMSHDVIEVSFKNSFNPSDSSNKLPLSVDIRYILRSGVSGFHCYSIYERPDGSKQAFDLAQTRMVFKLRRDRFHYMAITDEKQRIMPMPDDLLPDRGKQLIVPESVLLVNPINRDLKGEVDDKYQYSMDNKDGGVHGWISSGPIIGFWIIFPSNEFRNGGPTKQNLTVHTGPNCLAISHCEKIRTNARFVSSSLIPAKNAYVGLSSARTEGAWQTESKDYQFWVQTDSNGNFIIENVIPGVYGLHGWVPGFIGDYLHKELVTISAGSQTELGNLTYVPVRDGPTVWEIGYPDRTAIGFYVPDVNPMYVNKLFLNCPEQYRQYGLWDRYTDTHPQSDQVFTVGISDTKKDWFFAHVDRRGPDNKYLPTTWTIKFNLDSIINGVYKLRLAIASATRSDLMIYVNYINQYHLVFEEMNLGMDNTVCRHGIHGLYQFFIVDVSSLLLIKGDNSMFLVQARGGDSLCGVLYDYLRLEAPASPSMRAEIHIEE